MKRIILGILVLSIAHFAEEFTPKQFKLELMKNCEVLMLHEKRDRKSKTTHTFAANGDCVENLGCVRDITEKELENMDKNARRFAEWKNPVWCKVAVGGKQGWVQRQFLADKPCTSDE